MSVDYPLSRFSLVAPERLDDVWLRDQPVTLNQSIAPAYPHQILITTRFVCISNDVSNWFWWPIKPKSGRTRIWLYAFQRHRTLAKQYPVLLDIAACIDRVAEREEFEFPSFEVLVRGPVISFNFPDRGAYSKSNQSARADLLSQLLKEFGLISSGALL